MNHKKIIISCLMLLLAVVAKAESVYVYGIAYSPTDSITYLTDIRLLENVKVQKKTKFLQSRNEYSTQLKQYMTEQGLDHYVCTVVFKPTYKSLYKDYVKYKKYLTKRNIVISTIDQMKFQFRAITE